MPDRPEDMQQKREDLDDWLRRLRELRVRGEAGRREIVERLATMPLDQLRRVPGWVIVRLGPRGMAALAERSRVIRVQGGGSPEPKQAGARARAARNVPEAAPSWLTKLRRRQPLWWECVTKATTATAIGWLFVIAFPYAERAIPVLLAQATQPGMCSTLDRFTGDCIYITGSTGLSLATTADNLGLPLAALAAANPTLNSNLPLPRGTRIYVPRRAGINLR